MSVKRKVLKQTLAFVLVFAMLAGVIPTGYAENAVTAEAAEAGRQVVDISKEWKFKRSSVDNGQKKSTSDSNWEKVDIPHCYNAEDGHGSYYRGDAWYRKTLKWDDAYNDKRVVLQFLGANMQADVYVNENHMGNHKGGYTAFRYDITDKLKKGQDNLIAVKVNNKKTEDIAPLSADFTFYGGIYREVSLILTDTVHVDTMDYASSGLKLTTSDVSEKSAKLNIKSTIKNDGGSSKKVKVKAVFKHPDSFEEVPGITPQFDVKSMYGGGNIKTFEQEFTINAGKTAEFSKDYTLQNPRLWNGLKDPYRYQVDLTVSVDGKVVDNVTEYVGFRYFSVDYDKGFFLNGKSYPLRGVCRHQDKAGKGNALSKEDHDQDFAMIYEIGANCIRLAHYPHAPYVYEICDKYGLVVWAEIPFVNNIGGSGTYKNPNDDRKSFFNVTKQQLVEMIRQNYNRPSILFWGLQNEVRVPNDNDKDAMKNFMKELNKLAHDEDKTGRLTTQATDKKEARDWESDLIAWNKYPGWYGNQNTELGSIMDSEHKNDKRPFGISEYGSGSNIAQHDEVVKKYANTYQPEEYANQSHERYYKDICDREYFWGTFLWNMFDFAAAGRDDGSLKGVNTKGIVTMDRKTKKDIFYYYQSMWTDTPVLYLTSRRFTERGKAKIRVSAYSNLDSVTLTMNGKTIGTLKQSDLAQKNVFVWENVELTQAVNTAKVVGTKDGKTYTDEVKWNRKSGNGTTIKSDTLRVNNTNKTVQLTKNVKVEDITKEIESEVNAYPSVYKYENGKLYLVESGEVKSGMILRVTSEDRTNNDYFTFVPKSLAAGKNVTVSSEQKGNETNLGTYAVDGKETTRWAASSSNFPEDITIDLGEKKDIRKIDTTWFEKRSYKYKIYIGDNKSSLKQVADKTGNTTVGYIRDEVNASGRYVKIEVTGGSSSGNASIYEIDIFGTDYKDYGVEGARTLEAEEATMSGSASTTTADDCSGGKYVGNLGNDAKNKVTFKYNAAKAGKKSVDVYYMSNDKRNFKIKVNGGSEKTLNCNDGKDWTTPVKGTIELDFKAGENTIEFGNSGAYAPNLDRIVIAGNAVVDKDPVWPEPGDIEEDDTIDKAGEGMVMHTIQAEKGKLENDARLYDTEEHIIGIGGEKGGTATYTIACEKAGTRKLRIYYAHQFESKLKVVVNGKETDIDCSRTGAFFNYGETPLRLDIALNEGTNTIIFKGVNKTDETPYIDFFNVELTESEAKKTGEGNGTATEPNPEPPVQGEEGTAYEAEKATLTEECKVEEGASCSEGKYVSGIGGEKGGQVTFDVTAEKAGIYTVDIYYITQDKRNFTVTVNEQDPKEVACPGNGNDMDATVEKVSIEVSLNEGKNTIILGNTADIAPNLDKIVLNFKEIATIPDTGVVDVKGQLKSMIETANIFITSGEQVYTAETWEVFEDAYNEAVEAVEVETDAEVLSELITKLDTAMTGLKKNGEDEPDPEVEIAKKKTSLTKAINGAKSIYENDQDKYKEDSWTRFKTAYENAEKELKNTATTAEALQKCEEELTAAQTALDKKTTDTVIPNPDEKEELEAAKKAASEAFEAVKEMYKSASKEYTEDSWSEFETAYEAMEDALADEKATAETLTKCTEDLSAAKEALVKKDTKPNTEPDTEQKPSTIPDTNVIQNTPQYMSGVKVTADKDNLYYGGNADNTATANVSLPAGAASKSITFVSNDANVAKVDGAGKITAAGKGDAVITAKVTLTNGESKDFSLNVTVKKAYIAKVKVKSTLKVGKKTTLKAKAYGSDKRITWKIKSGAKYAKLTKAGKLTAKAKGKVKVTAKSGKISKTFTIRIK